MSKEMLRRTWNSIKRVANGLGRKRKCYVCGKSFGWFTKYRGGSKELTEFCKRLDQVGSDVDNFGCMYCLCHDRERHLFMFFDRLKLWENMKDGKILHFAPEWHLSRKIGEQRPLEYVRADLCPASPEIRKMDATAIPFGNDTFDLLIANHLLEHIPDYRKALSEFHRVLKPGGIAVLQTPYSKILKNNFEDDGIDRDELRLFFYGQEDHVRVFGERQLLNSLEEAGFSLQIKKHDDYFDASAAYYYGVPGKEDLMMVAKRIGERR